MLDDLFAALSGTEGPLAYLVLAACAAIEYIFPPFPGDTVTLFGVFLAAHASYSIPWVFLSVTAGSVLGSLGSYGAGRWLGVEEEKWPAFLRRPKIRAGIQSVIARFERHGGAYLAINRFVPGLRSFFFVAAGMTKMPIPSVIFFGAVSAMGWNALLLAFGYIVGSNFDAMLDASRWYAMVVVVVITLILGFRFWQKRRSA